METKSKPKLDLRLMHEGNPDSVPYPIPTDLPTADLINNEIISKHINPTQGE